MDLMYKFHIGGEERLFLGVTFFLKLYYEAFCLGKEHQNLEKKFRPAG
tara:strand:+ start:326 stop:469 length:144 start_codon:yes stop_codon:yes gene_type:complete